MSRPLDATLPALRALLGDVAVEVMRALKAALDPLCLLNPGKVLP